MERKAFQVLLLQYISKGHSLPSGAIKDQFEEHLRSLSRLGLLKCIAAQDETRYEITDDGFEFLEGYRDLERGTETKRAHKRYVTITPSPNGVEPIPAGVIDLVVVIPALNEAQGVGTTIDEVHSALKGINYEILVVDGQSHDGTPSIASEKGAKIIHQRGTGYGDALRAGFLYAKERMDPKIIVMMDADLTYDPRDIPNLIQPILTDGADMVIGDRFPRMMKGSMTLTNRIGNKILSWVARRTLGVRISDTQCGLRAFRTELLDSIDMTVEGMPFATEMIVEAHSTRARIKEVPVTYRPRSGKTKLDPIVDGLRILATIIRLIRDTKPLLFFSSLGGLMFVAGLALGTDVTLEWLRTGTISRLPTVMLAVLLLIGSIQVSSIGLVADMIKRIRTRSQ